MEQSHVEPSVHPPLKMKTENQRAFSITIEDRTPQEVYAFWRNFQNLVHFMKDLESVTLTGPRSYHWVVKLKSGFKAEWDAEIIQDEPGSMIVWQSLPGSQVHTLGSVSFLAAPKGRGAIVNLLMEYNIPVPGTKLTEMATVFTGEDPESLTIMNLKRLKVYLETGEIPTILGQSSGRVDSTEKQITH